jgi:L-iditol 2-dehydrogenase
MLDAQYSPFPGSTALRAARLHGPGDVRLDEVPVPEPAAGEVLVRVRAVLICASDVRMYWDGHAGGVVPEEPISQGHEFSGDIAALGEGVAEPAAGTRVAVEPSWHCGECDMCLSGHENICRHIVFPSFPPRNGALAEYIACPAGAVYPIPPSATYVEGALLEPLGVAIHAVRLARLEPTHAVAILGAGAIGVCTLLYAKQMGVERITVVEPVDGRREWVRRHGAGSVAASARELIDAGWEADIVFECAGEGAAVEDALHLAKPAGKVIVVGIPHPERISFEANIPRRKELTIIFSRRSRDTLPEAVELAASGRIDLSVIPIRRFTLDQTAEAIGATASRPGDMLRAAVLP